MTASDAWFVERYTLARRIYRVRDQKAHDGFHSERFGDVPSQTWAEWFEWAFGMSLEEYAKIAAEGKHGEQMPTEGVPLCEYRTSEDAQWSLVRGMPGETYDQLAAWMRRTFPDIVETRQRS